MRQAEHGKANVVRRVSGIGNDGLPLQRDCFGRFAGCFVSLRSQAQNVGIGLIWSGNAAVLTLAVILWGRLARQ